MVEGYLVYFYLGSLHKVYFHHLHREGRESLEHYIIAEFATEVEADKFIENNQAETEKDFINSFRKAMQSDSF